MPKKGVIRKVDNLGRIVLPIEFRREINITHDDDLLVTVSRDTITLTKQQLSCIFCDSDKDLLLHQGKPICRKCILSLIEAMD